ncbi:Asp-tRNA(Asn)/Glu-tRNA(Gln) amidotransferase subunit GatA [Candidatus Kaiserbacteria bacterium]|nr:Asp-tRNA(Asn)/Glu-tRNA(Gln) amidotransferase subunit GatA [Candidatus Kaiserbacteria bacterium]
MKAPNEMTIVEAASGLRAREFSVRELWDACAEAAKTKNSELNAFLEIFEADEAALKAAQKKIDAGGSPSGKSDLLLGIPIATKDNILIEGKTASAGSKMLTNYRATYDAAVIEKLKAAGALFLGRTNMDEFAMGSSTEHSAFGPTKNPHDTSRVPGGSSGGSAAAVAAHMTIAALGSDTGGSIRQPAALTGLVGLKPTYGAVSRSGLIAMGSSLDQIGPLAKSVADARALYEAIRGRDLNDSQTLPEDLNAQKSTSGKMSVGVPWGLLEKGVDASVLELFRRTISALESAGHTVRDISLPTSAYALAAYYVIMPAEVSTNLARLDGMRYGLAKRGKTLLDDYLISRTEGFGQEARRRILLGTFVLSAGYIDAYYRKADAARAVLRREYEEAFQQVDVIAFPTTAAPAFHFGEKSDPLSMYLEDIFTVTANLTGMPAISVPMGTVSRPSITLGTTGSVSLPVGIHFTAPPLAEARLFKAGELVEQVR